MFKYGKKVKLNKLISWRETEIKIFDKIKIEVHLPHASSSLCTGLRHDIIVSAAFESSAAKVSFRSEKFGGEALVAP